MKRPYMKIKNTLLIILFIFFINNAHSNYIKSEKIIFKKGENITLKSKINKYCDIVKLFTSNKIKLDQKDLKNKIIKELIILTTYPDSIKKYNITLDKESLDLIYKDAAQR